MRTRIGNVPDSLISLSLLLVFLIAMAVSVAGQARTNVPIDARAANCFDHSLNAPVRTAASQ
ncbi:MAG: hypothetical protein WD448_10345 [Woeseia sp.]